MTFSAPRQRIMRSLASIASKEGPLDAFTTRDVVANNLLHHADQACARVLVNMQSSILASSWIAVADTGGKWGIVHKFGPFALSTEQRGGLVRPYSLRVAIDAGSGDGTGHKFAVVISARDEEDFGLAAADIVDGGVVRTFGTVTAASAWLTPDSTSVIVPTVYELRERGTQDEQGGTAITVQTAEAFVIVRCIGTSPRLYGLVVSEVYV